MNKREIEQNEKISLIETTIKSLSCEIATIQLDINKIVSRLSTVESDVSRFENTYLNVLHNDVYKHTKEEKIYAVEFNSYTNALNNVVSDGNKEIGKTKYIHIPEGGLLVKESELDEYRKYGNGFASTKFVGTILTEE